LKKTGIGFHGDTERVIVICITIGGGGDYPMRWQWFKDGMPVGKHIDIKLNDGDVYIMSEKAVGSDWKLSSLYTLRHSAGAEKYRSLTRWEKRRPAYEEKLRLRAEKLALKAKEKEDKKKKRSVKETNKKIVKEPAKELSKEPVTETTDKTMTEIVKKTVKKQVKTVKKKRKLVIKNKISNVLENKLIDKKL
jgi:hypothetical protein